MEPKVASLERLIEQFCQVNFESRDEQRKRMRRGEKENERKKEHAHRMRKDSQSNELKIL